MKKIALICAKDPTEHLLNCIRRLEEFYSDFDIAVIDSASSNRQTYESLKENKKVKIHFAQNRNYEFGAWRIGYELYPDYDIYMCIQDVLIPLSRVEVEEDKVYTWWVKEYHAGFSQLSDRSVSKQIISGTIYEDHFNKVQNTPFQLATHCSFILNNEKLRHMLNTLTKIPVNKQGSYAYERILGIAFDYNNYDPIDVSEHFLKINGRRT